jgi:hypothetical protein
MFRAFVTELWGMLLKRDLGGTWRYLEFAMRLLLLLSKVNALHICYMFS